jgi:hypothetical protein
MANTQAHRVSPDGSVGNSLQFWLSDPNKASVKMAIHISHFWIYEFRRAAIGGI